MNNDIQQFKFIKYCITPFFWFFSINEFKSFKFFENIYKSWQGIIIHHILIKYEFIKPYYDLPFKAAT